MEREKPRLKPSRTVRPREGNRTSPMAGNRSCTPRPQGAGGGLQRTAGNQLDGFKAVNTDRGHSLRTPLNQSDGIQHYDPGAEDGSYRPGKELQRGQTSQRDKGRGQEGPSSKRRDLQGSDQHQEGARRTRARKSPQVTEQHMFVCWAQTGLLLSASCRGGER